MAKKKVRKKIRKKVRVKVAPEEDPYAAEEDDDLPPKTKICPDCGSPDLRRTFVGSCGFLGRGLIRLLMMFMALAVFLQHPPESRDPAFLVGYLFGLLLIPGFVVGVMTFCNRWYCRQCAFRFKRPDYS